jgi:putative acetyltransferase
MGKTASDFTASVQFRRATNEDTEIAKRIVGDALGEHGLGLLLDTSDKDLGDLEAHYDARGGGFEIVFLVDDTTHRAMPVGVLGWRPGGAGTLELKKIYLAPEARGRGLGRALAERVIARAREEGYSAVVLETANVLESAIALYTRLGFRPVSGRDAASFADLSPECEQAFRLDLVPPA